MAGLICLIIFICVPTNTFAVETEEKVPAYIVLRMEGPADLKIERDGESISTKEYPLGVNNDFGRIDLLSYEDGRYMFCIDYYDDYELTFTAREKGTLDYTIRWYNSNEEQLDERNSKIDLGDKTVAHSSTGYVEDLAMNVDFDGDGNHDDSFVVGQNNGSTITNLEFKKKKVYMRVGEKKYMELAFEPKEPIINLMEMDSSEIEIVSFDDFYFVAKAQGSSVITLNADGVIAECEVIVVDKSEMEVLLLNNQWIIPSVVVGIVLIIAGTVIFIIILKKRRKKRDMLSN